MLPLPGKTLHSLCMSTSLDVRGIAYTPDVTRPGELAPVAPEERIDALDLLRGWAMFGVLWSNLNDWYGTADPSTGFDRALAFAQEFLVESRFYTLLCFLFGAGFGLQLLRAAERGKDATIAYYRRTLVLLGIGLVHGFLVWSGDILTMYALAAFALVLFRDARPRTLLIAAAILWIVVPEVLIGLRFITGYRYIVPRTPADTANWVLGHGTWMQIERVRANSFATWYEYFGLMVGVTVVAMFLAGLWSVKTGYLQRLATDRGTARRLLRRSLLAATVGYVCMLLIYKFWHASPGQWTARSLVFRLVGWETVGTALAYAAILLLIWQRPRGQRLLRPLAATGRMALTTYLVQSVVSTLFFYSYGVGKLGSFGYTGMFVFTIIVFSAQMAASTWWLSRFRFGPAEWVWRTLTYGHAPRFRV